MAKGGKKKLPSHRKNSRQGAGGPEVPPSLYRPGIGSHPGRITSPWTPEPAPFTPPPATARRTTSRVSSTTSPFTPRWTTRAGSPRMSAFFAGQFVFDANEDVIRKTRGGGRPHSHRALQAPVPPLLALQEPDHLPGHGTVVHLHGEERSPAEGPGGDRPGELDSPLGPGPDLRHDPEPAGLVHLPPARLGGSHHRFHLQGLRRTSPRRALRRVCLRSL